MIGLVPTMGALHPGHLSLIENSKRNDDITICSIFVNPIQFNNPEDLEKYPSTIETDLQLLEKVGCDYVFLPDVSEIYGDKPLTTLDFGPLSSSLEGEHRPNHFSGVGIIVSKLFNIIQPQNAYFGQKDLQQYSIIKRMVYDLGFPIEIHLCPIVRSTKGLALSSRNMRLSEKHLAIAPIFFETLQEAIEIFKNEGSNQAISFAKQKLNGVDDIQTEYIKIIKTSDLSEVSKYSQEEQLAICGAIYLGDIRLIDNIIME